jgi:site-specific recombinase XerD
LTAGGSSCARARPAKRAACRCTSSFLPLFTTLKARSGPIFRNSDGEPYVVKYGKSGQLKTAVRGAALRSGIKGVSLYTTRHTVSTQLVVEGVHQRIKDQILGHAVTEMSRRYTDVLQPALIEAINKLPVPDA